MLINNLWCLLRFLIMGCVNKKDKKLLERLPKMIKNCYKIIKKKNQKLQKIKKMSKKTSVNGHHPINLLPKFITYYIFYNQIHHQ